MIFQKRKNHTILTFFQNRSQGQSQGLIRASPLGWVYYWALCVGLTNRAVNVLTYRSWARGSNLPGTKTRKKYRHLKSCRYQRKINAQTWWEHPRNIFWNFVLFTEWGCKIGFPKPHPDTQGEIFRGFVDFSDFARFSDISYFLTTK